MREVPRQVLRQVLLPYLPARARLLVDRAEAERAKRELREMFVRAHLPERVVLALGGVERCVCDHVMIDGREEWIGNTSYIDRIRVEDLDMVDTQLRRWRPACAYLGRDSYQRAFVAMRYWTRRVYVEREPAKEVVTTLFQRYTDEARCWSLGTCYGMERMPGDNCVAADSYERVRRLMAGETVRVGDEVDEPVVLSTDPAAVTLEHDAAAAPHPPLLLEPRGR